MSNLANEMKDTLKELLVECLNAGKKGSKTGVDPSMYPSQVNNYTCLVLNKLYTGEEFWNVVVSTRCKNLIVKFDRSWWENACGS